MNIEDFDDAPDMSVYTSRPLNLGEKITVVRARLGLTQAQMAELMKIKKSTLQSWEQERFTPSGASSALIDLLYKDPYRIADMLRQNAAA